jgi:hypothetical protein
VIFDIVRNDESIFGPILGLLKFFNKIEVSGIYSCIGY